MLFYMCVNYVQEYKPAAIMLSLFPKPYGGVGVGDLHGSGKGKEALQLSERMKVNSDFGAKTRVQVQRLSSTVLFLILYGNR